MNQILLKGEKVLSGQVMSDGQTDRRTERRTEVKNGHYMALTERGSNRIHVYLP